MTNREIDYYIKNLSLDARQRILEVLKDEINPITLSYILEKNENYPSFRKRGYTDSNINTILKRIVNQFELVNKIMEANGRYPLFEEPKSTYPSALRLKELLMRREEEYLIKKFGCTWKEYNPIPYIKEGFEK